MQRFCFTLDLRPDPALIAEYVRLHQQVWPEIKKSIAESGVVDMQIYRIEDRLFMILDATDDFTLERKAEMDAANPRVIEWEALMARFQQVEEGAALVRKWRLLEKVFGLHV